MKNLSYQVAVASVCTALGFVLGASPEAKAASFNFAPAITFEVTDTEFFGNSFDGLGDEVFPGNFDIVLRGTIGEAAQFAEFNIGSLSLAENTIINSAIFQAQIGSFEVFGSGINDYINPRSLGIFGYVGNGIPDISDFEMGVFLNSVDISSSSVGDILRFDVTSFVNQRARNGDTFAGFGIRALNIGGVGLTGGRGFSNDRPENSISPRLIVETAEPVPEPTAILGSAIGLCVGGWLKRKKSSQHHKTTSQG